jgi:hypothetical protein
MNRQSQSESGRRALGQARAVAKRSRTTSGTRRCRLEPLEQRQMLSVGLPSAFLPSSSPSVANVASKPVLARAVAVVSDNYGHTFSQATPVTLAANGSGSISGTIGQGGEIDMFRVVAPLTGQMTIRETAAAGSSLDSYLQVYDAGQRLLARNDDSGGTLNSLVTINVTAGATYYVAAAAYSVSTGAYSVQFSTKVTSSFSNATPVTLAGNGSGSQSGSIAQSGDSTMYRIVAPVAGQMVITESAAAGSQLDSYLSVYDATQKLVAENDDYGQTRNSRVAISVAAGATYYVKAAAFSTSTGAYVLQFSTTASTPPPTPPPAPAGNFNIELTITGMTTAQQQIVQQAAARWEQLIVGDLPPVTYNGQVIDDIRIDVSAVRIDGVNGTLGQSAPTGERAASHLPYLGFIQLDTADVAAMQTDGSLLGVLEHEMGHVLGFGTIWTDRGLLAGSGTGSPRFTGHWATVEYNALFGTSASGVPVESTGGSGTALSHWSESVFGTELMTGWYNTGQVNPLSRITLASMADLGYQVNMAAADAYLPPAGAALRVVAGPAANATGYGDVAWSPELYASPGGSGQRQRAVDALFGAAPPQMLL